MIKNMVTTHQHATSRGQAAGRRGTGGT